MRHTLDFNEVNEYISKGHTLKEAAYNFHVKYDYIASFCRVNKITHYTPRWIISKEELTKIAKGKTVKEISDITGVSQNNVRNRLTTYGIPFKRIYKKPKDGLLKDMIIHLSNEFSAKSIVEQLHLPHAYVYNTIQEYRREIHDSKGKRG